MGQVKECFMCLWKSYLLILVGSIIGYHVAKLEGSFQQRINSVRSTNLRITMFTHDNNLTGNNTMTSIKGVNVTECNFLWKKNNNSAEWFYKHFNGSTKPAWIEGTLSHESFEWWNNLIPTDTNQSYQRVVNLAHELAMNPDLFLGVRPSPCIRCAVVGNSGNLKNSGYGNIIDGHDIVIRMNQCPTVGYEKDVGTHTTHYVAYPLSFNEEYLRDASFVLAAFDYEDMIWLQKKLAENKDEKSKNNMKRLNKNKIFLYNPELMWHIKHEWGLGKGRWASTGLLCIFFALQVCDEVDIFGYGANKDGNWDHYFENNNGEKNSGFKTTLVHDSAAETNLMKSLADAGKIAIYNGTR